MAGVRDILRWLHRETAFPAAVEIRYIIMLSPKIAAPWRVVIARCSALKEFNLD
jgi:hypothetical protein